MATLAGCETALTGDPRSLNPPEIIDDRGVSRAWEFPRGASDEQTPVQVYLEQEYPVPTDSPGSAIRFRFGVTVFGYSQYRHNRIRLRLHADRDGSTPPAKIYVQPLAGGFTSFRTYVDDVDTIIVLDDLEETGTLHFNFLIDPRTGPHPETIDYQFDITVASDDLFTQNAVASDSGRFPLVYEDG
jgi:hypothetical protein